MLTLALYSIMLYWIITESCNRLWVTLVIQYNVAKETAKHQQILVSGNFLFLRRKVKYTVKGGDLLACVIQFYI